MSHSGLLKSLLLATRSHWDHAGVRPEVRENFNKVLICQTPVHGAEVYASATEMQIVPHTCKSRACPTCGYRNTLQWQREQWALLPDIAYAGIVFTMPDVLWPIFEQNRHLLRDLPALAAAVVQQWAKLRFGVDVLVLVVQHTFGRHLNFYPHLHLLVSAGGFDPMRCQWVSQMRFNKRALMKMWKFALISYLRKALHARVLFSELPPKELETIFKVQYERWWNVHIDHLQSKKHFLRYAGRYLRRPPLALRRIIAVDESEVRFWTKDTRTKKVLVTACSHAELVEMLAKHVPARYANAVRYFGLLSPRGGQKTCAVFMALGQPRRERPKRLSWQNSLLRYFQRNPLIDSKGQAMHWSGRLRPLAVTSKTNASTRD